MGGLSNLRDFIYLDVERLKSLLAQMDEGLLDSTEMATTNTIGGDAKIGVSVPFLGEVGGAGQYVRENQSSETRTLHDFVYSKVEARLLDEGRLRVVSKETGDASLLDSDVRASLSPVEYVLVHGYVQIHDYDYLISLFKNFNDLAATFARFQFQPQKSGLSGKEKAAANKNLQDAIASLSLDPGYLKDIVRVFEYFLKGRLLVKVVPFPDDPDIRIAGPLQRELLRERMEDIRYKYGAFPEGEWSIFGQISSVPPERKPNRNLNMTFSNIFEGAVNNMYGSMGELESFFQVGYPEIAITPIAIYRD